ncbi:ABC transporter substrate-binding protein [Microvirga makkahensis]|uniref:Transporter substrate-binding domain-containing protein n=1 Tax=Microvirga makkahensis TaxID=1128670 RepID=A0A7X3MSX4_9HYPH|nr:ABC transporter substrate-binding protein [Microvirga makkahensis]MXQ12622.1 transporter substrate-binding domain-containing protein [Microvirga makkahensis]
MYKAILAAGICILGMTSLASAQDKKEIVIASEGAYPPFNFMDSSNRLQGFDIDIANALCEKMQVKCTIVAQDWDGMIPALLAKKFDAIIASMTITEERKKQIDFTDRYYRTPLSVAVPKDSKIKDTTPASMKGLAVGAQSSTTQAIHAEDVYGKAGADAKLYPTQDEANADLANGRLDAVVADKFVLVEWLKNTGKDCCKLLGDIEGTMSEAGIAIRKEDEELKERFNKAIRDIVSDGTYKEIQSKYFEFDIY